MTFMLAISLSIATVTTITTSPLRITTSPKEIECLVGEQQVRGREREIERGDFWPTHTTYMYSHVCKPLYLSLYMYILPLPFRESTSWRPRAHYRDLVPPTSEGTFMNNSCYIHVYASLQSIINFSFQMKIFQMRIRDHYLVASLWQTSLDILLLKGGLIFGRLYIRGNLQSKAISSLRVLLIM